MNNIDKLSLIRSNDRVKFDTFLNSMFDRHHELHGDRNFADDEAIFCGMAALDGIPVCLIGQRKGFDTESNVRYNFGMPRPEGYRKAKRILKVAEKFEIPVIMFIDTPGAYPGIDSEERGQGQAIADMLYDLSDLRTQLISVIISEGGSGGALAIGVSDYIYALENCYYSVISPEGYAEILFKGKKQVSDVIDDMPIFIEDLLELQIVDEKVVEPADGARASNSVAMMNTLKADLANKISELKQQEIDGLVMKRYERYRKFGDLCLQK